jgi:zinc transport system ATP-binding protein
MSHPAATTIDCHQPVVELENVSYAYGARRVIDGLNLTIRQRDFVGVIGPNGAGKTTLLRLMVGLLKPERGEVRLFGTPLPKFKEWHRIGYVPQRKSFNLLFPATVREVVLSGLFGRRKLFRRITRADQRRCDEALEVLGIASLAGRRIGALSGGQQQRVFLARALIGDPELLILDEPTTGVDAETQENFFGLLRHMHQKHKMTFLMVSHDTERVRSWLGLEPQTVCGGLSFHIRHSHDAEDCAETDLLHTLRTKEG